jgi:hypothetical protein
MNQISPDILQTRQHALEYWNIDGLPTIFRAGAYLLLCGLFAALVCVLVSIHDTELGWVVIFLGVPAACFFAVWFSYRSEDFIERLKERVTYPWTGYAAPPSQWKKSERDDAFDASFGHFSGVARFFRKHWYFFYCVLLLFGPVNDIFGHPFHPSISSKVVIFSRAGNRCRCNSRPEISV